MLLTAHALHPLTILPVGRPLLPLDTISYGVDAKTFEELTAQRDDRSPIVVGLHAPGTDAGTLCILDASRATEEFGRDTRARRGRRPLPARRRESGRAAARHAAQGRREARGRSDGRLASAEFR